MPASRESDRAMASAAAPMAARSAVQYTDGHVVRITCAEAAYVVLEAMAARLEAGHPRPVTVERSPAHTADVLPGDASMTDS